MLILSCKKSNVFTVTFSTSNQYVYSCAHPLDVTRHSEYSFSGGADDTVLKYDLSRYTTNRMEGDGPIQSYTQHSVSVDVVDYYCRALKEQIGLHSERVLSPVPRRCLHEREVGTRNHIFLKSVWNMHQRRWLRHAS